MGEIYCIIFERFIIRTFYYSIFDLKNVLKTFEFNSSSKKLAFLEEKSIDILIYDYGFKSL